MYIYLLTYVDQEGVEHTEIKYSANEAVFRQWSLVEANVTDCVETRKHLFPEEPGGIAQWLQSRRETWA
jgi:hypothetical protein